MSIATKYLQSYLSYNEHFSTFSKPRLAKIVKSLVDYIALVPRTERLQIELSEYLIQWCIKEKRTYLKNRIELKLAALYL
jgi:26S proteasome regulatory subunit N6